MPENKYTDEAMVAFYLPDELARRLAISSLVGGEKSDHLRITLVYLGKVEELNREAIGTVMQLWATKQKPISGDISGVARFAPESDGKEPFVALFDSPDLPATRQSLMELLAPFIRAEQTHGFTPHITLAYLEPGASAPLDQIEREEITFTEVAFVFGDSVQLYVLAGRTVEGSQSMPYPNVPSEKTADMDRCVHSVMAEGHEKDSAIAICYRTVVEGRTTEEDYPWDQCIADQKARGYSDERARKICGSIKAKYGKKSEARAAEQGQIADLAKHLAKKYGGDPSFFTKCVDVEELANYETGIRQAICARAHKEITGIWPGEHGGANPSGPESARRSREYCESAIVAAGSGPEFAGHEWDVTIIGPEKASDLVTVAGREYVRSKNGRYYACEALAASLPLWEGIKVYDNHLTDAEFEARQGMRSVASEWIGTLTQPRWEQATKRLCAHLKIVDETLAHKLKAGWDGGVLNSVGLSIDTVPETREALIEGKRVPVFEGFKRIFSVDLVAEPAAGGRFNRLIQSVIQEATMELTPEVIELIKAEVARALAGNQAQEQDQAAVETPEEAAAEVGDVAQQAATDVAAAAPAQAQPADVAQQAADAAAHAAQAKADEIEQAVKALECRILLRDKLDAARMAESLRKLVEQQFAGRVFKEAQLDTFIKHVKEAVAPLDASGQVSGLGTGRSGISVGLTPQDKAQIEFLRLVAGNEVFRALESNQVHYVRERVPEAYQGWIKAGRPNYGTRRLSEWVYHLLDGDPLTSERAAEAVTTSSMSSIVKNTVNILLAANYSRRHEWWQPLVRTEEVDTIDDATLARVYGLNSLSIVEEGQPYTELPWADEEETASFVKKGNYVGITLETLLRDKLNVVRSLPDRLATSWYNTLSALVSGVFTVNTLAGPQLADGGALFNASAVSGAGGHANLLTAALSLTAYSAARTAMMKQTDQVLGAGQKLLIEPKFLLVPADLETTALQIRNSEQIPGSANNDINPFYQKFEPIVVPNWTDAADWALVADPNEFPAIWLIFLTGKRVPELFTADSETQGAMFTNDTLRYKVRMLTYRFSSTYECAPVADFRPVHKSNC